MIFDKSFDKDFIKDCWKEFCYKENKWVLGIEFEKRFILFIVNLFMFNNVGLSYLVEKRVLVLFVIRNYIKFVIIDINCRKIYIWNLLKYNKLFFNIRYVIYY